jgi:hypothetical protein
MMAHELIEWAQALCRHRGIRFPSDLRQYAHQWQRERFDLEFCWRHVKSLLSSNRPLWQAEVEIRRYHDRLQRDRDAEDVEAGEPLETTPEPACRSGGILGAPWMICPPPRRPVGFRVIRMTSARARNRGKRTERHGSPIGNAPAPRHIKFANC